MPVGARRNTVGASRSYGILMHLRYFVGHLLSSKTCARKILTVRRSRTAVCASVFYPVATVPVAAFSIPVAALANARRCFPPTAISRAATGKCSYGKIQQVFQL